MTDTAATECGYCEGHGYTHKTVLGYPGIAVECSECDGTGSTPTATAATCPQCGQPVDWTTEHYVPADRMVDQGFWECQ